MRGKVAWFPVGLNVIACIGWSTINSRLAPPRNVKILLIIPLPGIVGAQALRAVSTTNKIPVAAAIIIIAVLTFFAPFFGYKVVHTYERYSWIPVTIIFFIVLGLSTRYMDLGSVVSPVDVTSGVLSFGAAVFGFGIGWSSYAAGKRFVPNFKTSVVNRV